jgi:hypothetical protein
MTIVISVKHARRAAPMRHTHRCDSTAIEAGQRDLQQRAQPLQPGRNVERPARQPMPQLVEIDRHAHLGDHLGVEMWENRHDFMAENRGAQRKTVEKHFAAKAAKKKPNAAD